MSSDARQLCGKTNLHISTSHTAKSKYSGRRYQRLALEPVARKHFIIITELSASTSMSGRRPRNHVSPYRQLSNTIVGKQHAEIND